jgi:hypothetical protein
VERTGVFDLLLSHITNRHNFSAQRDLQLPLFGGRLEIFCIFRAGGVLKRQIGLF